MKKRMLVAGLAVIVIAGVTFAQEEESVLKALVYTNSAGESLKYRIYVPDNIEKLKKCPMLLFLHGAGERGNDNKAQLKHSVKDIVSYSQTNKAPIIVIAPQCPQNMKWVEVDWSAPTHSMPKSPALSLKLAFELLEQTARNYPVDQKRIYVTGLSMGGYGTWDAIQRKPDYFAAAIPICGGGDTNMAAKLVSIPIWVFHGDKDTAVNPERSRSMVEAIKKSGGNPKYTEYPGVGHDAWTRTFRNPEVLCWLFDQKR